MLRPRDLHLQETNRPIVTEADLNQRLLQTTSSKELLAIMREILERQVANSEVPKKSRRHLTWVPKPCGIGYHTHPPLMKRFKALIGGLLGHIKGRGTAPDTWQRSAPVPLDKGTTKPGASTLPAGTSVVSVWQFFLWRFVEKSPASASTQSQHLRVQQKSETRGCRSHPIHGEMET